MDNDILCLPKPAYFQVGVRNIEDQREVKRALNEEGVWKQRSLVEDNESYIQVIPYVLVFDGFHQQGMVQNILAAERLPGGNEPRLHNSITLGFGGHVQRIGNSTPYEAMIVSVRQELREELGVTMSHGQFPSLIAFLQDDSDDVGRVHVGLVFAVWTSQLEQETDQIVSQEPDKLRTMWLDRVGLGMLHDRMEGWAHMVALCLEPWGLAPRPLQAVT